MSGQHIENVFRRFKGEVVNVKTISGGLYSGRITEVTNDYVCLSETSESPGERVFLFFDALESMVATVSE
ncbi:MAG TPA: hypothetical protein VEV42_03080 [Pyrinomonadaceae bacterium]|nr:hypothetical protein [Pyrinomonadaceae bacterium]